MATATERRSASNLSVGQGVAYTVKNLCSTVSLAASASGTTIDFGNIPSNARILGASTVYWDDLATSGSPDLDIGLAAIDSNVTSDPDALNDGLDISASGSSRIVKDVANIGLPAWDFVNGVSVDPGGSLQVYGSVTTAATNATGDVTLDLYYVVD